MEKENYQLICSYIKNKYFISTVYRRCSAVLASDIWYFETIVWEWDSKTRKRGEMLEMEDSGISEIRAIESHLEICKKYIQPIN
jgi:hypothetical protein